MKLNLGIGAYQREYGDEFEIEVFNRFFERSPTNLQDETTLLSRPGTSYFDSVGDGPIRRIWSQDGTFGGAAFIVSGQAIWRRDIDGTKTNLSGLLSIDGTPEIDGTEDIVWMCDGSGLYYYNGDGRFATGELTVGAIPLDTETVTIGDITYTFVPVPLVANDIKIGATVYESLENLAKATLALTGSGAGSLFGTDTEPNPLAFAFNDINNDSVLRVQALTAGPAGNATVTTETLTDGVFDAATLESGVAQGVNQVIMPDDVGVVSLGVLAGFVLCVASASQRVYFVRPGETTVQALDFFEAERIPDQINSVRIVGDYAWLIGQSSTEVWYVSGVGDVPLDRVQGRAYSKGAVEGTAIKVNESVIMVGNDGIVYELGSGLKRISTHGIEEQIRLTRETERANS